MPVHHEKFSPDNLKTIRRRAGMSRTQLGFAVGVSAEAVMRWEQGSYTPRVNTLLAVASVLDCPITALFSETTENDPAIS